LEETLGAELFEREGRRLALTEAGRIALSYAEEIFSTGGQLLTTLERGRQSDQVLRIGAVATLSRNFQESVIKPLLELPHVRLCLESGTLDALLGRLDGHELDLVLTNQLPRSDAGLKLRYRRLARQPISIVGSTRKPGFRFPRDLADVSMILPGTAVEIRSEFDALCEQVGLRVQVLAEVDDMAMMRLLARDTHALALVPSVVVRDELREKTLHEHCVVPGLFENFYAITAQRQFQHPMLKSILARGDQELLGVAPRRSRGRG